MLAEIWNVVSVFITIFGFIVTLSLLRDFLRMRKMLKTWLPVLQEFEKRIPLINQLGSMWGKLQKNLSNQKNFASPTPQQVQVRAKLVDNFQSTLPSNLPVIGTALAGALAKLSGNEKAIMLTDTEFLGSLLKLAGTASQAIKGIGEFFGGGEKNVTPKKRRDKRPRTTSLQAPNL